MDPQTDERLMESYQQGDASALEQLYLKYEKPLFNYIYRLVNEFAVAEDVLQEVFLRVIKNARQFVPEGKGSFSRWLYRIALNLVRDRGRQLQRVKATPEGQSQTVSKPQADEPDERIRQAVETLPPEQKEVLMLRIYADLNFKEIAQTLKCPLNTALGRMHYAIKNLRQRLGK